MNWFKKAKNEFNYEEATRDIWRNLIKKEQDRIGIFFDLENDDHIEDIKEKDLNVKVKTPGGAINQYKIRARLYSAGGDWENSINYFRCQLLKKWKDSHDWRGEKLFIYIPSYKEGNINLVKNKKDNWSAGQDAEGDKREKTNKNQLWRSLIEHCNKRIKKFEEEEFKMDYDPSTGDIQKKYLEYGIFPSSYFIKSAKKKKKEKPERDDKCLHSLDIHCDGEDDGY